MRRVLVPLAACLAGAVLSHALTTASPRDAAAGGATGGPPDFADAVERVDAGIVQVTSYLEHPRAVQDADASTAANDYVGSGFVYSADGLVVTNAHVVTGAREILVDVKGRGPLPARIVGTDPVVDVALLKVEATGLTAVPIGDPRALRVGQWVLAAGSPYRLPRSYSAGIVSGLDRSDVVNGAGYEDFIQTDAAVNTGNSGGPLLDAAGRVVGINTAILSRTGLNQGIALALPIDTIVQALEQLRTTGRVVRPTLGLVVRAADPQTASRIPGGGGLEVVRYDDDSPGRRAGISVGDVILKIDGIPVRTKGHLQRVAWARAPGTTVQIEFWRGGRAFTASCVLGTR